MILDLIKLTMAVLQLLDMRHDSCSYVTFYGIVSLKIDYPVFPCRSQFSPSTTWVLGLNDVIRLSESHPFPRSHLNRP